jgi:hypothetical protein
VVVLEDVEQNQSVPCEQEVEVSELSLLSIFHAMYIEMVVPVHLDYGPVLQQEVHISSTNFNLRSEGQLQMLEGHRHPRLHLILTHLARLSCLHHNSLTFSLQIPLRIYCLQYTSQYLIISVHHS